MRYQLMLSESRTFRGNTYDHVLDVVECDDPEVLLDVIVGRWQIEGILTGGKKLKICTLVSDGMHDCTPGTQHELNFFSSQLCVIVGNEPREFSAWCEGELNASQKSAEDHNLGSD